MTDAIKYVRGDETLFDYELEDLFEEEINETCVPFVICGYLFDPGSSLRALSPGTFRDEFVDWLDAEGWNESV